MPVINYNKSFQDALKIMNKKKLGLIVLLKKLYLWNSNRRRFEKEISITKALKIMLQPIH